MTCLFIDGVMEHVLACHGAGMEIRGEFLEIGSLLPNGFQGLNSGHQTWGQVPLLMEAPHQPNTCSTCKK